MSTKLCSVSEAPRLGGRAGMILFAVTLLAFVTESQLTQYVQTNLHYRRPFFIFYLAHSSLAVIFPLHLLYLTATTKHTSTALLRGLQLAITDHLSPNTRSKSNVFPVFKFFGLVIALTTGFTFLGLLWFVAISLASVSDVTAIWNTNAIFAYLITVKLFGLKWEAKKITAVTLATLGAAIVVYGGSIGSPRESMNAESGSPSTLTTQPRAPLTGNLLTLLGASGYGLYQVLYKKYATLPSDPEVKHDLYQLVAEDDLAAGQELGAAATELGDDGVYPPPSDLYPNLLTSLIGTTTCLVLWVFLPILHITGIEVFQWPSNGYIVTSIAGIAVSSIVSNSGGMILLGMWGPIVMSVGSLLSIVLVLISDVIFGNGMSTLTIWSLLGSGAIMAAFGVLAYDMFTTGR